MLTASGRGRKRGGPGNGPAEPGPQARSRSRRRSPKDAGAGGGRRGGGRSRATIGASRFEAGFHETFHGGDEKPLRRLAKPPNRRRPRESPRGSNRQGNGRGLRPETATRTGSRRGFGRGRDPGKAARPSGGAAIQRGFRAASRRERFLERREGFGPAAFERATGGASAPMRARGDGAASVGPDPEGKRRRDFGPAKRPDGDRRGACLFAETHRDPNGASRPRCGIRGKRPGLRPRRDPEAAQREMASPPSDGSQGWDKWGPVATPAPIIFSAASPSGTGRGFVPSCLLEIGFARRPIRVP